MARPASVFVLAAALALAAAAHGHPEDRDATTRGTESIKAQCGFLDLFIGGVFNGTLIYAFWVLSCIVAIRQNKRYLVTLVYLALQAAVFAAAYIERNEAIAFIMSGAFLWSYAVICYEDEYQIVQLVMAAISNILLVVAHVLDREMFNIFVAVWLVTLHTILWVWTFVHLWQRSKEVGVHEHVTKFYRLRWLCWLAVGVVTGGGVWSLFTDVVKAHTEGLYAFFVCASFHGLLVDWIIVGIEQNEHIPSDRSELVRSAGTGGGSASGPAYAAFDTEEEIELGQRLVPMVQSRTRSKAQEPVRLDAATVPLTVAGDPSAATMSLDDEP